jgi:broad specificity phosphatase PhoE
MGVAGIRCAASPPAATRDGRVQVVLTWHAEARRMAKAIELRRHTDNDGDVLTDEGARAALAIGSRLPGGYSLLVSTGAQRATQTLACFACALRDPIPGGAVVEPGLRSEREDRWREAYKTAGSGRLEDLRSADPDLVESDARLLGEALRRVLERLDDGEAALVVGHSPTNEAAVFGLTGEIVEPMSKGSGVRLSADGEGYEIEPLE